MSKRKTRRDDPAPEYDFSKGVRGKYVGRNGVAGRSVTLDDDVAREFRDDRAVNEALRAVVAILRLRSRRGSK